MSYRRDLRTPSEWSRQGICSLFCLAALQCAPAVSTTAQPGAVSPGAQSGEGEPAPVAGVAAGAAPASGAQPGEGGSAAAPASAPMQAPRFDFEAMLARERAALPLAPVADPKGRWRASIESRARPLVVDRGDHVSVRASIGAKDEMRCEVHDGQLNPGATVANLLTASGGTIALEDAVIYRVGSAGGAPVLFVRARYMTRDTPPLGGELKIAVSPGTPHSFLCLHDEPGYREAFVRSVEGFVSSFETSAPTRPPQYSAISQLQVGEARTGYTWERIFVEPDGSVSSYTFDLVMAQLASGELRIRDYMAAEQHDQRGLVRANFLSYRSTTQAHEIQLERLDAGGYAYRGSVEGKPVEGRFNPKAPLASNYEVLVRLQKAKASPGPLAFRQDEYHHRQDPRSLQSVEYSLDASHGTLTRKAGTSAESWTLSDGLPSGSRVTVGPNTFVGTVVSQHSSLGSEPGLTVGTQPVPEPSSPFPLVEQRRGLETQIFAESERTPAKTPPAAVLSKVTYPAPLGANVAYATPSRPGAKRPAVVWVGAGLDWGIGESAWLKAPRDSDRSARAFRDAGLVLMLPALRGSNENPGRNECFLGEVDDLIAAANYLGSRPDVNPERIYLAGHATGGTLALLTAASTERFRAVFALGPVSDVRQYGTPGGGGCLPVDADARELAVRAPANFVASIRTPTYVFEGGVGGNADVFDVLRERASRQVRFTVVPGVTSTSIVTPASEAIARAILADSVDDEHLSVAKLSGASKARAATK
jgi:acetyl esterase/lipase